MAKLDSKISKGVSDKYKVNKDTQSFAMVAKDNPKDKVEVEVGDSKDSTKFHPQIKVMRWDNEVNLSVRLKDDQVATELVSTDKEKVVWSKGIREVNLYDLTEGEGGYEFEVILKEKPASNKIEFTLQDKDVDYFYQPELTAEEIAQGASRPDNVVGSYAVYAKTPKTNWTGGKEYKCGKVGHIYRPKIIDSAGTEVWGDLHIENGILSVTIPQDFLDKAVYPVRHAAGLTFGYTGTGASNLTIAERYNSTQRTTNRHGITATGAAGTLDKISAKLIVSTNVSADTYVAINIKNDGGAGSHSQLALVERANLAVTTTKTWFDFTCAGETLSAIDYVLSVGMNPWDFGTDGIVGRVGYDTTSTIDRFVEGFGLTSSTYALSKENPWTVAASSQTVQHAIYATYTAAVTTAVKDLISVGVIAFPR
jgi:hypothetical protein